MTDAEGHPYAGMPRRLALPTGEVLRPFEIDDVPGLVRVVNDNLDRLRPWMPWAGETVTVDSQTEFVRSSEDNWAAGTDFVFGIVAGDEVLGGTGLHTRRGPDVLEIGYWLRREAEGRGLVTAAARALTVVAASFPHVSSVAICCDEANVRSAAVPPRLGYSLVAVEEREPLAADETGWHQVWSIDADVVRESWLD
jgi:RimJ/RimL family protein N-acetyltransferase